MRSASALQTRALPIPALTLSLSLCLFICLCAALPVPAAASGSPDPFAPSSTGIRQIGEIMGRLAKTMGDIPPNVDRLALSQIKTDPKDFSPGMSRYIQAQIEEIFRKEGRRTVVTSPELRTFRVVATDSSFKFSNTLPTMEDLWKLGDKLRVDGYIEGSCSKSADNDVILNLKVFRHRTGEVVWSNSFVAGPNEKQPDIWNLEWTASANVRLFPVKEAIMDRLDTADALGNPITDTIAGVNLTSYGIEGTVSEVVTPDKFLLFSVSLGYGLALGTGGPDSLDVNFNIQTLKFGIEMLGIFFRKSNPDLGYWLGTYLGYQEFIPFGNRGHLSAITVGYKSRVSRHFTLGGGVLFFPLNKKLKGLGDNEDRFLTLEPVAYELTYLHYTF
jgi:hypothetical protein